MDAERLERWLAVCPEVPVPAFRHLSAAEAVSVRRGIAYNLGMDNRQIDTNPAQLMGEVHKQSILQESEPGAEASAILRKIFEKTPGLDCGEIYLSWGTWDDLYCYALSDILFCFDCLWLPVADDVDLIGSDGSFVIFVSHEGEFRTWFMYN